MYDTREINDVVGGIRLTNTVIVIGWLKWLWIVLVAKKVAGSAPRESDALIEYVRGKDV